MRKINIIPNWITYGILFIAAFLFVFLFSCTTSPLYDHHPFWFHGDSGIFQEMGICLAQGGTPYVDLFDHKGPVLWFIQAFGILISPQWGIMMIQTIFLFVTLILWYKSVNILTQKQILSLFISFLGLFVLMAFCQRGNLCEEWSLPFISLPIFIYILRWKTDPSYKHIDCFVIGLCVGMLAMIRLNNTAPIIGFVLWHIIYCIKGKEYKRLWNDIALICCGIAIVLFVCSVFYYIKASWSGVYEMFYGTFIFNFIYIKKSNELPISTLIQHYTPPICFAIITLLYTIHKKTDLNILVPLLISYFITFCALGLLGFIHYMILFIPLFIISLSLILPSIYKLAYIFFCISFIQISILGYEAIDHLLFRLRGKTANTEINDGFHRFVSSLPSNERKSIYNAGLNHLCAGLFADENIYQCNRIIYKSHTDISTHLQEFEATHGIEDLQPTWILTQSPLPEVSDNYIQTHYTLADSIPGGEFDPIWCWKRVAQHE